MTTNTNCQCSTSGHNIQLTSDNPYSHISKTHALIEGYQLQGGWKLYDDEMSWIAWLKVCISDIYNQTIFPQSAITKYIFNLETGEVYLLCHLVDYQLVKVGQFDQETEHPYIYMDDSSYIRVLPKYKNIIKNSPYAKQSHQKYMDNLKADV
jgi:hypothetical protein